MPFISVSNFLDIQCANLYCTFLFSEDIPTFVVDVALVVESGRVHHCLPVRNAPPCVSPYIFPKLDRILLHLFDVLLLSCAISVPDTFVISRV